MAANGKRILLTGANGFIAAHCVRDFLLKGYIVRFTVRDQKKVDEVIETHKVFRDMLEPVIVPDMTAKGAYNEALQNGPLDGVIHTASPFHFNFGFDNMQEEILTPANQGTYNLLEAISELAPDVKRVVITSSFAAMINPAKGAWPDHVYSESDWNPVTLEDALNCNTEEGKITVYRASKTLAERGAWQFVETKQPSFDLVTLCPPMVYGPILNQQSLTSLNTSNERIWQFLSGNMKEIAPSGAPFWVDVRDLSNAHVAAFEKPNAAGRRVFIVSNEGYTNHDIAEILRNFLTSEKSEISSQARYLARNIPESDPTAKAHQLKQKFYTADNTVSREVLGVTYRSFEECMTDTAKSLVVLLQSSQS